MADFNHNPLCSFEAAILWVVNRDVDASPLFPLQQWPDKTTEGFWRLLRELTRGTIRSVSSFSRGQPVDAAYYQQAWSALKAAEAAIGRTTALPVDENLARQIEGLEGMRVVRSVTTTSRASWAS
jgi:hypothetical protein